MPRFYFHLRNDVDVPDNEGNELPDIESARSYAMHLARFEISETIKRESRFNLDHRIDIEDEEHRTVETIRFRDVVQVDG